MTIPYREATRIGTEERFVKAINPRLKRYGRDHRIYCQGPDIRPGKAPDWVIYLKPRGQAQTVAGILRVTGLGSGEEILVELERTEEVDLERLEALWSWLEGELDALGFVEVGANRERPPAEDDVSIPSRLKDLYRWRRTWRAIHDQWDKGRGYKEMSEWLHKLHPDLEVAGETLRKIIQAGEAGKLD